MSIQKKIISITLFIMIYVMPFYLTYKKKGISFSGNINLENSVMINNWNELVNFSNNHFFLSLDLMQNGIFVFFISALIFKSIINLIQ